MRNDLRKGKEMKKRAKSLLALLLAFVMMFGTSLMAFAETGVENSAYTSGLCEHHTEHDDDCGYQPAVEGTPCGYVCELCESEDPEQKDEQEDEQKDGQKTFTVAQVEAMIDALPDVEYVEALDPEEDAETLEEIYLQAADAADAFDTLSVRIGKRFPIWTS